MSKRNPISWIPTVYFSMGIPFITISMVAVLMMDDLHISHEQITFWTSLLVIPWSLKPLSSLIMETFGRKKQYVVITEMVTAIMFGLIAAAMNLPQPLSVLIGVMAIMAVSGSVHDIAGDGTYMAQLNTSDQSKYIGWQGAFYNLAKILANGGLVYLAGVLARDIDVKHAWMIIMLILGVIMLAVCIYHIFILPDEKRKPAASAGERFREFGEIILGFFRKKYIFLYILFIILYRLAEGLAMKVVPLFLKASTATGGIGLTNEEYGITYGTFGTCAFILGSILAGYFISHFGLKRVLVALVCIFNIPFAVYLLFAIFQPSSLTLIASGIVCEYFGYGFGFVGLNLFMMQQVAPGKHQMAHYAFANSIMNLGIVIPGMISGTLCDAVGYKMFFTIVLVAAIPIFLLSMFIPFTHAEKTETTENE